MSKQKVSSTQASFQTTPVQNVTVNSNNGNINTQRHNIDN